MDKKDEIIASQIELIRQMTESNIKRLGEDIWGRVPPASEKKAAGGKEPPKAASAADAAAPDKGKAEETPPPEKLDDLLAELDSYIGLSEVKKEVRGLINMAKVYKLRREHGLPVEDVSLHMVFSGNPGTGKTMIARFMARVYRSIGILSKGTLVECDRGGLVAGYIGQTAIKTTGVLESALGGVLFIDEAYALTNKTENDFGLEAVDTVLKYMEDHRDDLVVIVAGYTELMEDFIDSNPGLRSRFNKYVDFADYTGDEMTDIFVFRCKKGCYTVSGDAEGLLRDYFAAVADDAGEFGNARGVRNVFEKILSAQADRLAEMETVTKDDLMLLTADDVKGALGFTMPEPENTATAEEGTN